MQRITSATVELLHSNLQMSRVWKADRMPRRTSNTRGKIQQTQQKTKRQHHDSHDRSGPDLPSTEHTVHSFLRSVRGFWRTGPPTRTELRPLPTVVPKRHGEQCRVATKWQQQHVFGQDLVKRGTARVSRRTEVVMRMNICFSEGNSIQKPKLDGATRICARCACCVAVWDHLEPSPCASSVACQT